MFARMRRGRPDVPDENVLSIANLREARGVEPKDYVLPDFRTFEARLIERLQRLIESGATDAETLNVLDGNLLPAEREFHHGLDDQRVVHRKVSEAIVQVAKTNVLEATNRLEGAELDLDRATEARRNLEQKLTQHDPDRNMHV